MQFFNKIRFLLLISFLQLIVYNIFFLKYLYKSSACMHLNNAMMNKLYLGDNILPHQPLHGPSKDKNQENYFLFPHQKSHWSQKKPLQCICQWPKVCFQIHETGQCGFTALDGAEGEKVNKIFSFKIPPCKGVFPWGILHLSLQEPEVCWLTGLKEYVQLSAS